MPVRNCCLGCQGPMAGPCGPTACRCNAMDGAGPCCVHAIGCCQCNSPCGDVGVIHGYDIGYARPATRAATYSTHPSEARGGVAGSYFSCGHGCIGGCTSGICGSCCGPACG